MEELFSSVPLFKSLGRKEIHSLAEIARNVDFPPNTVLFQEGEIGDRLYVIVEGRLDIVKKYGRPDEHLLRICGPGEYVGEMCFLNPEGTRTATVRTRTAVRLIEITKEDFEALMSRRPAIAFTMAQGITQRMLESETRFMRVIAEKDRQLAGSSELGPAPFHTPGAGLRDQEGSGTAIACPQQEYAPKKLPGIGIPRLEIQTFGKFQVSRGETQISDHEWKAKQPKLLLKALIARGGARVPKDVLIEDLWPTADPSSGESNFKVVLHRLRKALEPSRPKGLEQSYLILKDNLLSLKKELCRIDLDEFMEHIRKGRKAEQAGDIRGALHYYRSAINLYMGDFLKEDLYVPWAELKRTEIRIRYLDLLSRTADLYNAQGSSKKAIDCYRAIIEVDRVYEEAYRKLMMLYSSRGMRTAALKIYRDCEKALEMELGVEPDDLTKAIYRKLMQ
ncbi:MAG: BTAD domain-containing putative transcriptional regulator [Syntrophobacteraceae bacterium]